MEKAFVVKGVATQLFATEDAIDSAMAATSKLMATMLAARRDLNLSATVGNDAMAKVSAALAALSEARTAIVISHGEMADTAKRLGVRTVAGGQDKTGGDGMTRGQADSSATRVA